MSVRAFALLMVIAANSVGAQTVTVTGLDGPSKTFTAGDLKSMGHVKASLKRDDGVVVHYAGVPLEQLLRSVGAPFGHALRGPEMADIVVVSAKDGYRVALALTDVDPGIQPIRVILADEVDTSAGVGPLADGEGPFRLVVEGDGRPARSARMVTAIKVERAP